MSDPGTAAAPRSQMPRGLIVLLAATGLLVTSLAFRQFTAIIGPILLALILVIGVHPLTGFLRRRGWPTWLAVTGTLITLIVVILGLAASMALAVGQLATLLPTYADSFTALVNDLRAWLGTLGVGQDQIQNALGKIDFANVVALTADLLVGLASTFSNLLFLIFVAAFMTLDALGFASRVNRVRRQQPEVIGSLDTFVSGTRSYLLVSTLFGLIVAAVDIGFLWLVGVPLALLWGLLAFVTNYIPNIGFLIGLIPPALLALLDSGPQLMIIVIVAYSVINFVIQSLIQPKIMSDTVNLSLTLTLLSVVFWTFVVGPIGAILAIPLTLLTKALLLDMDPKTRWISSLLEGGPAPPEDEDADEAAEAAEGADETSESPSRRVASTTERQESHSADGEARPDKPASTRDQSRAPSPDKGEAHRIRQQPLRRTRPAD
ncbi:AI-2E family transporter [Amycolatopsis carbonis]|uniref:AI-2E family transporter n=1 Tax=Amycolatopsis carbonis TaxID=715471 RepID=A0A9Y2MQ54_9PSEU|nr:AI-2E family transporter [Amycolatopsis sp. 2-15]WIX76840.1 AI-2E family transporter [Amycolatopsis sp. 2-15]